MHEEAKALFGEDDSNPTSFSDLPSLSFCHAVLQEGLRLAGPVVWMAKECIAETTLSSVTRNGERAEVRVPKGALIRENFVAVHYDARVWEDPYAFKPERFLEKGKKGDSDGCKCRRRSRSRLRTNNLVIQGLPFSSGLRGCIGKDFAISERFGVPSRLSLLVLLPQPSPSFSSHSLSCTTASRSPSTARKSGLLVTESRSEIGARGFSVRAGRRLSHHTISTSLLCVDSWAGGGGVYIDA